MPKTAFRWVAAAGIFIAAISADASARASDMVAFRGYEPGTIVVRTTERHLYLVVDGGVAGSVLLQLPRSTSDKK